MVTSSCSLEKLVHSVCTPMTDVIGPEEIIHTDKSREITLIRVSGDGDEVRLSSGFSRQCVYQRYMT